MVKVTVVNSKNFTQKIKFIFFIIFALILLFLLYNYKKISINSIANNNKLNKLYYSCLDDSIPGIKLANSSSNHKSTLNIIQAVLYSELPILKESALYSDSKISYSNAIENLEDSSLTYASENVATESITNNVPNTYTNDFNGVEIKNGTNYELTNDLLNTDSLKINKANIIIFHTHTCESYTPSEKYQYDSSGNYRTIDLDRSVSKVGNTLTDYLTSYGYLVTHDTTYHDYPAYTGSYGRSMVTVQNLLLSKPNTDIIIDIHRDAISDTSYAPSVKIGDDIVAQLMFVLGTDGGGLEHPNWKSNLKFAIQVQQKGNSLYPGLFKPIVLRNSRYNQQLGNAACIIEVGATGNTLDQATLSMKYLSYVLNETIKNLP